MYKHFMNKIYTNTEKIVVFIKQSFFLVESSNPKPSNIAVGLLTARPIAQSSGQIVSRNNQNSIPS